MESVIEVNNLSLTINKCELLKNISVSFEQGKIHGLVGRNGSGKTMLLKCICGFVKPSEGTVMVDGYMIGKDVDYPQNVGIIIETPGFVPYYSGYKNLKILATLGNCIDKTTISDSMKMVGLDPLLKLPVRKYSLGMRQRLGIAQAIMENPDILILDEPFNGLDKDGVVDIRNLFVEYRKRGKTIVLCSHSLEDINYLCDTVYEMERGCLSKL